MAEARARYSQVVTILDKKNINIEAEKLKVLKERENLIKNFEEQFIFDETKALRKNIKVKNYVDGSKYEGEGNTASNHSHPLI